MRKGSHLTEENKLKISLAKKGKRSKRVYTKLSDETKQKISDIKKGKPYLGIVWNKGLTKETSETIAIQSNPITNERKRLGNIRRKYTWGDKVSRAKKGIIPSIAGWNKGLPSWNKGLTKETDKRMAEISKISLKRFENLEWVKFYFERCSASPNKSELKLLDILNNYFPNEWAFVGDGKMVVGGKIPDYTNINGKKQLIELFGTFWHKGKNPQIRINSFMHFGFATIVIWEHELKDELSVVNKVNNFPLISELWDNFKLGIDK